MLKKPDIEKYILAMTGPEDPVLKALARETHLKVLGARMLSEHLQGQVLTMISKISAPQRILELGTFTGYSAICLAKGLPEGGRLITIEKNDELEAIARKYFQRAGLEQKIELLFGAALEILTGLKGTFDLVFLDADKREYPAYYRAVFDKVKKGGLILADNTLWNGKVVEEPPARDLQARGIMEFNKMVKNDPRTEQVILPLRDGMTIIRKK